MSATELRAELDGISLAWWPGLLLNLGEPTEEQDSFDVSLAQLASALAEEDSLS